LNGCADYLGFVAFVGGQVALPCNVTAPSHEDIVALILWYRDDSRNPIYTVDGRTVPLDKAKHFSSDTIRSRVKFNITYPLSFLRISPVRENDGGEYRCRVDFRRGRTINYILNLNVIVPPKKIVVFDDNNNQIKDIGGPFNEDSLLNLTCEVEGVKPREVSIVTQLESMLANERYELVCQSSGSRPPAKLSWFKDGNLLSSVGESISDDGSLTTNFLAFVPSIDDNNKVLSCAAKNPRFQKATIEESFVLKVNYAPILSLALGASIQHQEILEGSDVFFECNIQANPAVTKIGWLFNGEPLKSDLSARTHISNGSLLIQNVGRIHRGSYQCWAVNAVEKGNSEVVTLNVKCKIHFDCNSCSNECLLDSPLCKAGQRVHYGVARHEEAVITCEVEADPSEVTFHWSFNSTVDEESDSIKFIAEGRKSIATYTPRAYLDYGVLYCWAENNVGRQLDPCLFFVIPAGPPDPPENCTVTNITAHTLTIECLPGYSGGLDQTFHLEIYNSNTNKRLINNLTSSEYPFFIANALPAGNSFRLVTYASNSRGRSPSVVIKGNTLVAERWQTGKFQLSFSLFCFCE
ncbi:hemicentin-1-like protein, partial [Leptotrombidium deliense]